MNKRTLRWGCILSGLVILVLLMAVGGWWFFSSQSSLTDSPPLSPVNVFMISPASGDELNAGDFASVSIQAFAPEAIQSAELFVDGVSLGVVSDSPQNASWSWQAWPVGIHTLVAHASMVDGQTGQSQTVIVSVLASADTMKVAAQEGQTLDQVGGNFGVPPDQMASANPNIDPTQPLKDGQPVQVPVGGKGAGNGSGSGSEQTQPEGVGGAGGGFIPILINWQFKPTDPVDKSYCYTSPGDGTWEKLPKEPFKFFFSDLQTQYLADPLLIKPGETIIKVQCWGWLGNALKFLGEGETKFDLSQQPEQVMVNSAGFQLVGLPQFKPPPQKFTGGGQLTVPPPFAMREPKDTAECLDHKGNLVICDQSLNAQVKSEIVLEWEWQPKTCWPIGNCVWVNDIDGYYVYEIDPLNNTQQYMKEVIPPAAKVVALPLPWGYRCYGVKAYAEGPELGGQIVSEMTTYCPDKPPQPEKTVLAPINWLTTGGQWIQSGDCDDYGLADNYVLLNQKNGFGNQSGEVLVGSYIVDDDGADCFRQGDYSGGVEFATPVLPTGAVIQKALLKFSDLHTEYGSSGVATNFKLFCVDGVGKAKQDWVGQGSPIHFFGDNILLWSAYLDPITSVSGWDHTPEVDVTYAVNNWIKNPGQNHGFILTPANAPGPSGDGHGECLSQVGNFQLEIYYFAP